MAEETEQDAITEEEMTGKAAAASSASPSRNASLMNKRKASPSASSEPSKKAYNKNTFSRRDGLGAYIDNPTKYDTSRVIFHNKDFVAINDLYPKSSVHTLLLPRSPKHNLLHPFDAFGDAEFLISVREQAAKLKGIVARELERKYGRFSKQDIPRQEVLDGKVDLPLGKDLPEGRAWEKEIKVGIHAHPSMNHLHIHVLSVDRYSECMKHMKHYNSFATLFFVDLADFPLAEDDVRRHPGREGYLKSDLKCWRCGKNFGNKFARLKEHLAEEFEVWKKE